jgi:phosphatidylglycerol---prolipoprotein diacylglyceryl transferase
MSPRKLAYIFATLGIAIFALLFFPVSEIFKGNWKLNQQVEIGYIEQVSIFGNSLPIGSITIRFYSMCILIGLLAGYFLALYLGNLQHIVGTIIDRLFIGVVVFGMLGARMFFVIFNWPKFQDNPFNIILELNKGGLAVYGALVFASVYVVFYCKRYKFNFYEFFDFLAPSVLLGQIIGRFGNFFNYESYGPVTSLYWKMYVPTLANISENLNQQYFHPTFLYEILPNFLLLIILLFKFSDWTEKRSGLVFAIYAIGYGSIRTCTEFFRLDALRLQIFTFNIYPSQLMSIVLLIYGAYILVRRNKVVYLKKTMAEIEI